MFRFRSLNSTEYLKAVGRNVWPSETTGTSTDGKGLELGVAREQQGSNVGARGPHTTPDPLAQFLDVGLPVRSVPGISLVEA